MNKLDWYNNVQHIINQDIDKFYNEFYGVQLTPLGKGYRINPCPKCGHQNCCSINDNAIHCFSASCGWKGTHITAWYSYAQENLKLSLDEAIDKLEEYTGVPFPRGSEEEIKAYKEHQKIQEILRYAETFYHNNLLNYKHKFEYKNNSYTPLEYLVDVRRRKLDTIKKFYIGFSGDEYLELYNELLSEGYTKEEIKSAKVWAPKNVILYFYRHPITHDIVRMNVKNPFGTKQAIKNEFGEYVESDSVLAGYSTFSKSMYFTPSFSFEKDIIVVEGENDLFALYENGFDNIAAIGGQVKKDNESQLNILKKVNYDSTFYLMFDNDKAGEEYIKLFDEFFPDRKLSVIKYNNSFNDPDEYYTTCDNPTTIEELIKKAEPLPVSGFNIYRHNSQWIIANRFQKLEFTLKSMNDKNSFKGTAIYYKNGVLSDRDDDILLTKCRKVKPLNLHLYNYMEEYFNTCIESKTVEELINIYSFSCKKEEIIKKIAKELNKAEEPEKLVNEIKVIAKKCIPGWNDFVDSILKENNDIQNKTYITSVSNIPRMRLGQYYNVRNGDAYMYFTYVKIDGDVKRKLPFLLRNDGTLIRLDLLKRKDSQCLLLIDNKYELPYEVNEAVLELNECCLTQYWVEKYIANEIPDDELDPGILIRRIESYLKRFYYTNDSNVYKIIALYIYSTYYYELFAQIPYLFLNGSKGSGKSILDECIKLFSFNCKMAVDITEAALFRVLSLEGGVLILDEMENLNSKNRTMDNSMAAILKGGYARSGGVYRVNTEKGGIVERYAVYGPKVISNIMGMDDVIEDRCIVVNTYPLKLTKETKMEDPKYYAEERLDEVRELTSKCALSALRNFKKLHEIYNGTLFETNNARLSQILTPILAVATLVDSKEIEKAAMNNIDSYSGEYQKALESYWETTLKFIKQNIEGDTPEGIIKKSVSIVARELWGIVPKSEIEFTKPSNHKYTEPIIFNKEEGWFTLNSLHLKCFIEEMKPGDVCYNKNISRWVKTVFNLKHDCISRRTAKIENEDLLKEFKGNSKPKVYAYTFYFKDFIDMSDSFLDKTPKKDEPGNKMPLF